MLRELLLFISINKTFTEGPFFADAATVQTNLEMMHRFAGVSIHNQNIHNQKQIFSPKTFYKSNS